LAHTRGAFTLDTDFSLPPPSGGHPIKGASR
jgi:hypothetical protein